jgi:hypothetical protein
LFLKQGARARSKNKASLRNFVPIFFHFRYHFYLAISMSYSEKYTRNRKRKIKQHKKETFKNILIFCFFVTTQWLGCISTHSSPLTLRVDALQSLHKYPRPTHYDNVWTLFKQLRTASKHEVKHLKLFKISELVSDGNSHPGHYWNNYNATQSVYRIQNYCLCPRL